MFDCHGLKELGRRAFDFMLPSAIVVINQKEVAFAERVALAKLRKASLKFGEEDIPLSPPLTLAMRFSFGHDV